VSPAGRADRSLRQLTTLTASRALPLAITPTNTSAANSSTLANSFVRRVCHRPRGLHRTVSAQPTRACGVGRSHSGRPPMQGSAHTLTLGALLGSVRDWSLAPSQ
jgi:hypothetical protein